VIEHLQINYKPKYPGFDPQPGQLILFISVVYFKESVGIKVFPNFILPTFKLARFVEGKINYL